jgi:predicted metalloprotease with PDZ domain
MRLRPAIVSILALGSSAAPSLRLGAQVAIATPKAPVAARGYSILDMQTPRAVIGVSTSVSTGSRDTLGLLVSSVNRGGPAEKAGIEEGNRIAMINGVNLKLAPADLGDPDMERLMSRRLVRELDKVKPGDEVDLRVYASGQTKNVKIRTVEPDSLYASTYRTVYRDLEERPTLGLGYGSNGSKRDTLGIFVMNVDEEGPAAKAGIEEGARIQAINGVDLRVGREDAGDDMVSMVKINRFERELNKVKPGDAVELRVYQNGQVKTVKANAVALTELRRNRSRIIRNGPGMTIIRHPDAVSIDLNTAAIAATARRAAETAATVAGRRLEDIGRVVDEMGRGLGGGATIRWFDDEAPHPKPIATTKPSPKRTLVKM